MRKVLFVALALASSVALSAPLNCVKVKDSTERYMCISKNIELQNNEIDKLQKSIRSLPTVSQKEKQKMAKEQDEWEDMTNDSCKGDSYCLNAELERRVNDLSFYHTSHFKHK